MENQIKFEDAFEALKAEVARVEAKDATLDDAIAAFEKGMVHYETCLKILEAAEQRIKIVIADRETDLNVKE